MGRSHIASIEEWITQAQQDTFKGGDLTGLAVVHTVGGTDDDIDRITLVGGLGMKDIAKRFDTRIEQRIATLPGMQSGYILAFHGDPTPSAPTDKLPWSRPGRLDIPGGANVTEGPTKDGIVTQMQRFAETAFMTSQAGVKFVVESFAALSISQNAHIERLQAENEKLRVENADAWVIARDSALTQESKQFEHQRDLQKDERNTELIGRLMQWGPALINRITDRKIFPEATEDSAIVEGLLTHMKPEHVQMLIGMLAGVPGGAQLGALVSARVNEIFKKQKDAAEKRKELTNGLIGTGTEEEVAAAAEAELQ